MWSWDFPGIQECRIYLYGIWLAGCEIISVLGWYVACLPKLLVGGDSLHGVTLLLTKRNRSRLKSRKIPPPIESVMRIMPHGLQSAVTNCIRMEPSWHPVASGSKLDVSELRGIWHTRGNQISTPIKKVKKQTTKKRDLVPHTNWSIRGGSTSPHYWKPGNNIQNGKTGKSSSGVQVNIGLLRRPYASKARADKVGHSNSGSEINISNVRKKIGLSCAGDKLYLR